VFPGEVVDAGASAGPGSSGMRSGPGTSPAGAVVVVVGVVAAAWLVELEVDVELEPQLARAKPPVRKSKTHSARTATEG
jgi:hypothetical protein